MTGCSTPDGWTFLKADKDLGSWAPKGGSKFTEEEYCITVGGNWVPTVDVGWLLTFKKACPCKPGRRIQMFAKANPTARQMATKPDRPPRMRGQERSNFGLQAVGG